MSTWKLQFSELQSLDGPTYFFSKQKLRERFDLLRSIVSPSTRIYYSFKANANADVLACLKDCGADADVASENELRLALKVGFAPPQIEFTGPGKSRGALQLAVESGIGAIVTESIRELQTIDGLAAALNRRANVSVRVSPSLRLRGNGQLGAAPSSQFGVDEELLPSYFEALKACASVDLIGVHVFQQSQLITTEHVLKNFEIAVGSAKAAARLAQTPLSLINLGGGFGIPYGEGDHAMDANSVGNGLKEIITQAAATSEFKRATFAVESGRFISGPAGLYVARVLDKKISRGKNIVVLEGGFSQNMAACGFGQLFRKNFSMSVVLANPEAATETVTIVGPSCYSLDVIATDITLPRLQPGDFVCIHNSGSYGASFSPTRFLQFEPAAETFLDDQ